MGLSSLGFPTRVLALLLLLLLAVGVVGVVMAVALQAHLALH